jgi:hypothetical protein
MQIIHQMVPKNRVSVSGYLNFLLLTKLILHRQLNFLIPQKLLILEFQAARIVVAPSSQIDLAARDETLRS